MHLEENLSIQVNFTIKMSEISIENVNFQNKKCCSRYFLSEKLELTFFY